MVHLLEGISRTAALRQINVFRARTGLAPVTLSKEALVSPIRASPTASRVSPVVLRLPVKPPPSISLPSLPPSSRPSPPPLPPKTATERPPSLPSQARVSRPLVRLSEALSPILSALLRLRVSFFPSLSSSGLTSTSFRGLPLTSSTLPRRTLLSGSRVSPQPLRRLPSRLVSRGAGSRSSFLAPATPRMLRVSERFRLL